MIFHLAQSLKRTLPALAYLTLAMAPGVCDPQKDTGQTPAKTDGMEGADSGASAPGKLPLSWLSADDRGMCWHLFNVPYLGSVNSWLNLTRRYEGPEYISYSEFADLPACSFDFGDQGYAASSNYGGDLLQMTARSDKHGILFARGDFEYSLYLSLARGQRERGEKSAFGLQVTVPEQSASYAYGEVSAR
jgi:hypothetical protein